MTNERGILIIATKNPYYGRVAYNLAVSIKAIEPECSVAVATDGIALNHLSDQQQTIFDSIVKSDESGVGSKLNMYSLSPFNKTLYIDADNLWLPKHKPSELFDKLAGIKFTAITEGKYDIDKNERSLNGIYELWSDLEETVKAYDLKGVLYQWRTEVVYFEKCKETGALFKLAKKIYTSPKVKVKPFAGSLPDEFAINVACCSLQVEPHEYRWNPCYWERIITDRNRRLKFAELYDGYFLISTGGNRVLPFTIDIYTRVAKAAFYKLGLQFLFPMQSKSKSLVERKLY